MWWNFDGFYNLRPRSVATPEPLYTTHTKSHCLPWYLVALASDIIAAIPTILCFKGDSRNCEGSGAISIAISTQSASVIPHSETSKHTTTMISEWKSYTRPTREVPYLSNLDKPFWSAETQLTTTRSWILFNSDGEQCTGAHAIALIAPAAPHCMSADFRPVWRVTVNVPKLPVSFTTNKLYRATTYSASTACRAFHAGLLTCLSSFPHGHKVAGALEPGKHGNSTHFVYHWSGTSAAPSIPDALPVRLL